MPLEGAPQFAGSLMAWELLGGLLPPEPCAWRSLQCGWGRGLETRQRWLAEQV